MPTFWGFMSPAVARLVTISIAALGIVMAIGGALLLIKGHILWGITPLVIFAITIYSVVVCSISLGKYRTKQHYRCLSCRLDWYEYVDGKE